MGQGFELHTVGEGTLLSAQTSRAFTDPVTPISLKRNVTGYSLVR